MTYIMKSQLLEKQRLEKELHLKQLQIKSLLTITQAINDNVSAAGLYNMYKSFLNWEMGVKKMALIVKNDDDWECVSSINAAADVYEKSIGPELLVFQRLHKITESDAFYLHEFDVVIPVFHKSLPIAYALIGDCGDNEDIYSKIQFITTITNVVAVAIENKRLFKQQLEQERLKREIELASEVQNMLIPSSFPKSSLYELASIYKPHFNVGGDYFDYIPISPTRFVICIADISGKGVAAALLMANFQANLRNLTSTAENLTELVQKLNENVYLITRSDKFLTFFIAYIDLEERVLRYINAGHTPPLCAMGDRITLLKEGCTIIGAFDRINEIEEGKVNLKDETTLVLFTDGLTDLKNESGQYFDEQQIKAFLKKNRNMHASDLNRSLMSEMESFNHELRFPDDIAVLTCKLFI
ncbi:MAG: PP2C family protein-serine/threonine phosphatase [Saprospiraceae bacterium]|nr:PP2C family protein-serine/threonine phosphatase [Saprospiraceae bacterium]